MKLGNIPFDGLFKVYERINNQLFFCFSAFSNNDEYARLYADREVIRLYPCDDVIIVEVK